jgi:hypothetical protein
MLEILSVEFSPGLQSLLSFFCQEKKKQMFTISIIVFNNFHLCFQHLIYWKKVFIHRLHLISRNNQNICFPFIFSFCSPKLNFGINVCLEETIRLFLYMGAILLKVKIIIMSCIFNIFLNGMKYHLIPFPHCWGPDGCLCHSVFFHSRQKRNVIWLEVKAEPEHLHVFSPLTVFYGFFYLPKLLGVYCI